MKIVEELRCRVYPRHEEPITSTSAPHVEQVAFRVVDLFEIGFVHNALDPGLKREDLVVATGDDYGPELEALGEIDRDGPSGSSWERVQGHCRKPRILGALDGPVQFSLGSDEHADLLWPISLLSPFPQPVRDASRLFLRRCESPQKRLRAVEGRDGAAVLLDHAVYIGNLARQEPICLPSNLMRYAVVNPQGPGTSPHVDAQGTPGERCPEDPLKGVGGAWTTACAESVCERSLRRFHRDARCGLLVREGASHRPAVPRRHLHDLPRGQ